MVLFSNMTRLICVILSFFPLYLEAKSLEGRFGAGVSYQNFTQSGALSLKFFHSNHLATNVYTGFNTESGTYLLGARSLRNVILEENMNVFLGLGASFVSSSATAGTADYGVGLDVLFGGEFFLPGLPNLGLSFEMGLGLRSLRTTSFRSIGGGFASGGIHYFF